MKTEVKTALLEALSNHRQGHGRLRPDNDCFCAVGVLCDIAPPTCGKWRKCSGPEGHGWYYFDATTNRLEGYFPPKSVCAWAGISQAKALKLVDLNDHDLKTFPVISEKLDADF